MKNIFKENVITSTFIINSKFLHEKMREKKEKKRKLFKMKSICVVEILLQHFQLTKKLLQIGVRFWKYNLTKKKNCTVDTLKIHFFFYFLMTYYFIFYILRIETNATYFSFVCFLFFLFYFFFPLVELKCIILKMSFNYKFFFYIV